MSGPSWRGWPGYRTELGAKHPLRGSFDACRSEFGARADEPLLEAARRARRSESATVRYAAEIFVRAHDHPGDPPRTGELAPNTAAWNTMSAMAIMMAAAPASDPRVRRFVALYLRCLCDEPSFDAPCPGCAYQMQHR